MNWTPLFWDPSGPLVRYGGGMLQVQDLNPEVRTQWRMTRVELLKFGLRTIATALSSKKGKK